MLENQDIICVAPEVWDSSWLDVHRYMHLLAPYNRILYVERPVSIAAFLVPGQRELFFPQVKSLLTNNIREVEPNLYVTAPLPAVPLRFEDIILFMNQLVRLNWIKNAAKQLNFKDPILWIYDTDAAPLIGKLGEKISLYSITDDYANNPFYRNRKKQIQKWDNLLMNKVDLLLASAANLAADKREFNPNTHYVPHGVESQLFAQALNPDLERPDNLIDIPAPIIGYVGRVNEPIDVSIIEAFADLHPDWHYVFVGPVANNELTDRLKAINHVHLLGLKPVHELAHYMKYMDVCIIPYKFGMRTKYTHPLKALEYLAAGKPVVSTPMPSLEAHKDYIYFAEEPINFVKATEKALEEDNAEKRLARSQYTHDKTWQHQVNNISNLIQQFLDQN